jgi:double-stranded uracil-DNA glycosylase
MSTLRDVVTPNPRVFFVGINPSLRSHQLGHHFAGPGNPFWRLLYAARIVPQELTYADDHKLANYQLALTNLCPRATRSASELRRDEIERGRLTVLRKIARLRPAVVAFVGASIYRYFHPNAATGGVGPKPETIHGARIFVLPNPSGLNANFPCFRDKLVWFEQLREFAELGGNERPATALRAKKEMGGEPTKGARR